jgi:hypothetical protein
MRADVDCGERRGICEEDGVFFVEKTADDGKS